MTRSVKPHKKFSAAVLVSFALASPVSTLASDEAARIQAMRDEAQQQKAEAGRLKADAETQFMREQTECYQKLLAARCVEAALTKKRKAQDAAKVLEVKGKTGEREARNLEHELRQKRKAAEAPARAQEEQERQEKYRLEEEKLSAKRAARQAERERKAAQDARLLPERTRRHQEKRRAVEEEVRKSEERKRKYAEQQRLREANEMAEQERKHSKPARKGILCQISLGYLCPAP